jgi:para-aminobenzoate synthetase component 1
VNPEAPFEWLEGAPRGAPVALLHSGGAGSVFGLAGAVDALRVAEPAPSVFGQLDAFVARHGARTAVASLGFDLRDAVEELPRRIEADFAQPVLSVAAFDERVEFGSLPPPGACAVPAATGLSPIPTRSEYEARVARVIEHIRAGDIFQANLTQPFTGRFEGDPRRLFRRLCAVSPAPFAAYFEDGDGLAVLSASPEEFLRLDGREVRTRPIKGTRPRDPDPARDAALRAELRASQKDLAELAMIVDLLRNDVGKVAEIGSVQVGPFPEEASFAHVHHLFTTVQATLRGDVTVGDLLRATFPGGSITGAPKLRCMEILEELEWVRRGVYTGSIGWIGPGPRMHLNIAIRTMVVRDGVVRFHVGGGVTADSDPAAEYEETLHKAAGMLAALGVGVDRRWA